MADQEKKEKHEKKKGEKGEAGHPPKAAKKEKKPKGQAAEAQQDVAEEALAPAPPPRLIAHYRDKVVPELKQKFNEQNILALPRLEKIVVSMGVGKYATTGKEGESKIQQIEKELTVIAGQKPVRCKAKKSVANFKVREGMETGLKVTLRGNRMYEFLDRLISLATPRVKDFRGLDPNGFDQSGNFNFGFTEQTVFPEVNTAEVNFQQGMNITIVTTANSAERGRELLKGFGFPFRESTKK